eukprot:CAMPEP_0113313330 /NCGR_PEP_ID=MMETSP0010_2-20120614/9799_1 /TAXON_ID=216773 ORGANISM="Corethron hystrix, Strain 308" /NCGR_SAMPLE_ID=MMETSP0010_2 /ASSEMBLY_ACC=CAM_ASM_000155 /LENGTH=529 /DNA_ID=CAMNT_0000169325 /DNA_START=306 /DNA_END=1895 /DNA_ORIENTATION=+ /assembly_acc=CAM_ASM_000155
MISNEAFDISKISDNFPFHFGSQKDAVKKQEFWRSSENNIRGDSTSDIVTRRLYENSYSSKNTLDISSSYDWWSQGYRMLGAFIDCDHIVYQKCSRWMMWAAYINPNYEGGGFSEYYNNSDANVNTGEDVDYTEYNKKIDCHEDDTSWKLLGVYRMELYQFIEQLSKHLWDIDSWEYEVVTGSMEYMTNQDCYYLGDDENGNDLYGGVLPQKNGYLSMGVFTDSICLTQADGYAFDDFEHRDNDQEQNKEEDKEVGEGEEEVDEQGQEQENPDGNDARSLRKYGAEVERKSMTSRQRKTDENPNFTYALKYLNEVLDNFKICRLCLDYPTYQDGYFKGTYGTDDSYIINQCWKFHSHNSYFCSGDCILLGHLQGSITNLKYGGKLYGEVSKDTNTEEMYPDSIFDIFSMQNYWSSFADYFVMISLSIFSITYLFYYCSKTRTTNDKAAGLLDDDCRKILRKKKKKALLKRIREKMHDDSSMNIDIRNRRRTRKTKGHIKSSRNVKKMERDIDSRHRVTYVEEEDEDYLY